MKQTIIRICALAAAVALAAGLTACGGAASSGSASSSPASGSASEPSSGGSALDYSKGITDEGFWEGVKALDYITLPEYKGVAIPADEIAPSAEDIQKLKDSLVESFGEKAKITDRAVEDGDQVNIDYVGSVDGVEFSGGSTGGSGTTVTAGSTNRPQARRNHERGGHLPRGLQRLHRQGRQHHGAAKQRGRVCDHHQLH